MHIFICLFVLFIDLGGLISNNLFDVLIDVHRERQLTLSEKFYCQ